MSKRYAQDEAFREVANILFGDGADDLVHKLNPDGADISTRGKDAAKKDRRARGITAGLSATGAAAGTGGLAYAARDAFKAGQEGRKIKPSTKALIPLEIAGLGGELMATKILHGDVKGKKKLSPVGKSIKEIAESASENPRRKLTRAAITSASNAGGKGIQVGKGKIKQLPNKVKTLSKSATYDIKWEGEISKVNADKQQVFGWASIVEMNGEKVVDLQGDYISIEEVEKAGYEYVQKSRKGGDMHLRDGFDQPIHASEMIESFIVTPEKKEALGLPEEMTTGWWVGYQVNDPGVWAKVKSGERTGFSIHGRGMRS